MKCTESRELRDLSMNHNLMQSYPNSTKNYHPVNGHSKENTDNISLT